MVVWSAIFHSELFERGINQDHLVNTCMYGFKAIHGGCNLFYFVVVVDNMS